MKIELELTKRMVAALDAHLNQRAIEIDGHIDRSTLADQVLSRVLSGARKAGYGRHKRAASSAP
jgi:hypothetical protein